MARDWIPTDLGDKLVAWDGLTTGSIVTTGDLTTQEQRQLDGYIAHEDGTTASLPQDGYKVWRPQVMEVSTNPYDEWTPEQLGDRLLGWFEFDDNTADNMTLSGSNITRIRDKSSYGNDHWQDTTVNQPVFGARADGLGNTATFTGDGVNEKYLIRPGGMFSSPTLLLTSGDPAGLHVAWQARRDDNFGIVFGLGRHGTGQGLCFGYYLGNDVAIGDNANFDQYRFTAPVEQDENTRNNLDQFAIVYRGNGGAGTHESDRSGYGQAGVDNQSAPWTVDIADGGPHSSIGAGIDDGDSVRNPLGSAAGTNPAEINLLVVVEGEMSDAEKRRLQGYIAKKGATRARIAVEHPYAGDTPLVGTMWSPAQAAPLMWVDPNTENLTTLASGNFSEILDRSGNGRDVDQGTAADQPPRVTSLGMYAFDLSVDATDALTQSGTFASIPAQNFFFVVSTTFNAVGFANYAKLGSTGDPSHYELRRATGGDTRFNIDGLGTTSTTLLSTDVIIYEADTDNTRMNIRMNGADESNNTNPAFVAQTVDAVEFDGTLTTGAIVREFIIFPEVTADTVLKIEGYLAWRPYIESGDMTLVNALDAGHPYKTRPPLEAEPDASYDAVSGYGSIGYGAVGMHGLGMGMGQALGPSKKAPFGGSPPVPS